MWSGPDRRDPPINWFETDTTGVLRGRGSRHKIGVLGTHTKCISNGKCIHTVNTYVTVMRRFPWNIYLNSNTWKSTSLRGPNRSTRVSLVYRRTFTFSFRLPSFFTLLLFSSSSLNFVLFLNWVVTTEISIFFPDIGFLTLGKLFDPYQVSTSVHSFGPRVRMSVFLDLRRLFDLCVPLSKEDLFPYVGRLWT